MISESKIFLFFLWVGSIFLLSSRFLIDLSTPMIAFPGWFLVLGIVTGSLVLIYYLYIMCCLFFYRPYRYATDSSIPHCTVIVPAYNEGKHVAETLKSLLASDYPADRLEIIAVDDGSVDDTFYWINEIAKTAPDRISVIRFEKNRGKKHGLYIGFLKSGSDIVVTVDSDTVLESDTLKQLTAPFSDPEVGGVAGNIRVKNLKSGCLPKMMDIGFLFGFDVIRSAQSITGCVMCTPGALSAYRKSIVLPFLEEWLNQKFLGVPATIGEDRAIATMILQRGNKIVFQQNAVAYTCIPAGYRQFSKMLIRWTRSDIRENFIMFLHAFRRFQLCHRQIGLQCHILFQCLNTLLPGIFLLMLPGFLFSGPEIFLNLLYISVVGACISALIPVFLYAVRVSFLSSVWGIVFAVFNIFFLSWIVPFSFVTLRNSSWLTRSAVQKKIMPCRKERVKNTQNCIG